MHILNVKMSDTSHFDRTCVHLIQTILTKWGVSTILLVFLVPKWGIQFIFTPKNGRTVSNKIQQQHLQQALIKQWNIIHTRSNGFPASDLDGMSTRILSAVISPCSSKILFLLTVANRSNKKGITIVDQP